MISQRISALTFLPPPKAGTNLKDYEEYVQKTKQSEMDFNSGEVSEKRSSIDKKSFTKGRQETLDDVIAT